MLSVRIEGSLSRGPASRAGGNGVAKPRWLESLKSTA
jgi:hypothetical protein